MRIINQTDKVMQKVDGKAPPKKATIPGLRKICKPIASRKLSVPKNTSNSGSQKSPKSPKEAPTLASATRTSTTTTSTSHSSFPSQTSEFHAELTAFMEPLGLLMDWELESFDLNDAMALDTKWLEGLDFLNAPLSPPKQRQQERRKSKANSHPEEHEIETLEPVRTHNEFRLVCHYCTHMTRFYSIKDPQWNFYTAVNKEFAYRYPPLRYAVLAWSSLHLSIAEHDDLNLETAQKYYQLALKGLTSEDFSTSKIPLEFLLVGFYFLCLFDVMSSQNQLKSILRHVWASLKLASLFEPSNLPKLSSFAYQVITWMIYLDVRSSLFIGNIQFPNYLEIGPRRGQNSTSTPPPRLTADMEENNKDVQYLLRSDLYEKSVVANIFGHSHAVLQSAFGEKYPKESAKKDEHLDRILVVMVKNMLMFATLIRLRNWLSECGNSLEFHPDTLSSKIDELHKETQALYVESNIKDPIARFHVLVELALVNAVIIYFDRLLNPDVRTSPQCQLAAAKIVEIAMKLKDLRNPRTPGSLQWPFPLVIAGIESADPLHQSWVLQELEDNEEEGWAVGLKTVRRVVRETIKRQNEQGRRVDIGEVMIEMNSIVII